MSDAALNLADAIMAVTEAVRAAANDPADQVQLLMALASFAPATSTTSDATGADIAAAAAAVSALCRRSALISLGNACAAYQPSSSDDAAALLRSVVALYDAEIQIAGDAGDQQSYLALRTLRTAVIADLTARGANLPALTEFKTILPMPALVLAYKLYRDASRADDLIARADPIHPAFMPTQFEALSS